MSIFGSALKGIFGVPNISGVTNNVIDSYKKNTGISTSNSPIGDIIGSSIGSIKNALQTSAIKTEENSVKDFRDWIKAENDLAWQRSQSSAQAQMDFQKSQSDLAWQRSQSSAQAQMDFQKEMFEKEMDYNERMSSTAYQRVVNDLRKAGLNPILAVSQGSASSPSVSAPSGAMSSAQAMSGAMAHANTPTNVKGDYTSAKQADLYALNVGLGFFENMISSAVKLIDAVVPL